MKKRTIKEKLITNFKIKLSNDEKSTNTIEKYLRDVQRFKEFANEKNIDKSLMLEYKTQLEREYALSSANSMIASVNSFLKFAGWHDCCIKQFRIQRKVYCSEKNELSKQEYIALVRTAKHKKNERLSLLIQTICGTGIRVSELKYITVEAILRGEAVVTCKGKTRKVFIVKELCKKLLRYSKQQGISSGAVFVTKKGKTINRSNVWREMKSLCNKANVNPDKVFPHNLRHLFARTFYSIEKDIAKLADILGHDSIDTTRIYIVTSSIEHHRKLENMRLII